MVDTIAGVSLWKRVLAGAGMVLVVVLVCQFASRLAVLEMFRGIAAQRATALDRFPIAPFDEGTAWKGVSRSAKLASRTTEFGRGASRLQKIVAAHHGEFEDLRTENRSGQGRALSAAFNVPAAEFQATLDEVKSLGRIENISEASEDASVKAARLERQVSAARRNLERLQSIRREHKAGVQDALALEKEIAKGGQELSQVEGEQQGMLSTVYRAAIRVLLIEEYRATMDVDLQGALLGIRNSLVEGVGAVVSSLALFLGTVFSYGLPIAFWTALLYLPARAGWKK
ncbi:MAG TPA: DUF4349 domain-containing protein, partial [Candidatus Solibacter sp.]|nr:DUF4349 domain-containing protein [Candidatus Solibacter sp.]